MKRNMDSLLGNRSDILLYLYNIRIRYVRILTSQYIADKKKNADVVKNDILFRRGHYDPRLLNTIGFISIRIL
jgi:hypothetical protein